MIEVKTPKKKKPLFIYCDGCVRGYDKRNPDKAESSTGWVIKTYENKVIQKGGTHYKDRTISEVEYLAIVEALMWSVEHKVKDVIVHSDSEFVIKQLNREYQIKAEHLRPFYTEIVKLSKEFTKIEFRWVSRTSNAEADAQANLVLDEGLGLVQRDRPKYKVHLDLTNMHNDTRVEFMRKLSDFMEWNKGTMEVIC